MKADGILDAIARKHSRCALIREVTVTDPEAKSASDEWWTRHRGRNFGQDPSDPYPGVTWTRRIDGLLLDGGGTRTAVEVKVSRADFARESDAKRDPWRRITNRFVYATPVGLLNPPEIPEGCGLWEIADDGRVYVRVRARINREPEPIPHQVLVALAYRLNRQEIAS